MLEAQGFDSERDDGVLLEVRRQLIAPTAKKLAALELTNVFKAEEKFRDPIRQKLEQTKRNAVQVIKSNPRL